MNEHERKIADRAFAAGMERAAQIAEVAGCYTKDTALYMRAGVTTGVFSEARRMIAKRIREGGRVTF